MSKTRASARCLRRSALRDVEGQRHVEALGIILTPILPYEPRPPIPIPPYEPTRRTPASGLVSTDEDNAATSTESAWNKAMSCLPVYVDGGEVTSAEVFCDYVEGDACVAFYVFAVVAYYVLVVQVFEDVPAAYDEAAISELACCVAGDGVDGSPSTDVDGRDEEEADTAPSRSQVFGGKTK
ncbi:hypothetical protein BDQ17DRAFT_1338073 [Cyathus striatus]|nr:hypothetical protein BDQ17DRAFT_1338073 [Cyathus striatus]